MTAKAAAELTPEFTPEQKRIQELEGQLARTQGQLKDALRQREGWLITTDNNLFDGDVYGISFINGTAFIGVDQHVAYFDITPESEESIKNRHMHYYTRALTDEDRKAAAERIKGIISAQRQREAMSTAERAVLEFGRMAGYSVEFFGVDKLTDLQARMSERANQRRQAEATLRAKINAEAIVPPGFMGAT